MDDQTNPSPTPTAPTPKQQTPVRLLVITIIAALVFAFVFFFLKQGITLKLPSSSKTPSAQTSTEIKVTNWKTYKNIDFSFNYPADWKIATQESKISIGKLQTETISNIAASTITSTGTGSAVKIQPPEGGSITIETFKTSSQSARQFTSPQFAPATKLRVGKMEIQTYASKQQGVLKNYLIIPYKSGTSSYTLSFDYYNYQHPDWDYQTLFKQIINSLKFNNEK